MAVSSEVLAILAPIGPDALQGATSHDAPCVAAGRDDFYEEWSEAALSGTYTPLPSERIATMFERTTQLGPANCWTGTTGELCVMVRELLRERLHLLAEVDRSVASCE